jgi:hypothetical protein
MKSASMADNAAHIQDLGVVRELEVHRKGSPFFQLTSQDEAQAGGAEVRRFAAILNISVVFEYAHLNGNGDPMALASALRFLLGFFNHPHRAKANRPRVSTFFATAVRQSIQQTQITAPKGNFSDTKL